MPSGLTQPKNKDDFKRLLVALTRPQMNQYGLGDSSSTLGLALTGRGDCPMAAMFGVPNNWAVDSSGKFTKDFETEQFKAALDFVRDLYASGVYYPDPLNGVTDQVQLPGGPLRRHAPGLVAVSAGVLERRQGAEPADGGPHAGAVQP